jgi:hypothetical protein
MMVPMLAMNMMVVMIAMMILYRAPYSHSPGRGHGGGLSLLLPPCLPDSVDLQLAD